MFKIMKLWNNPSLLSNLINVSLNSYTIWTCKQNVMKYVLIFSDFKKSIQFSPSPFNPNKKPEQGILKTPDSAPQKTPRVNVSIATPDGMKRVSPQKIVRQATPHIKKVRVVQRTPSSVKKLKTPVSSKKYTGTPVPKKSAPVMSLKTPTRAKAAAFFWNWCRSNLLWEMDHMWFTIYIYVCIYMVVYIKHKLSWCWMKFQ